MVILKLKYKGQYFLLLVGLLLLSSCQEVGDNMPLVSGKKDKQPIIIVNKNRHLNMAEFWIDSIENADKTIMDRREIAKFNDHIAYSEHKLTYFQDMSREYGGEWVKRSIRGMLKGISHRANYFEDGNRIPNSFFNELEEYMDLGEIDSYVKTRYALTVNYTNQRIVPTELALLKGKEEIFFDRNQNSALDIATPIAILHSTKDGKWHYGVSTTSSGWVRDRDIAFGERQEIKNYLDSKKFVISTDAKSAILIGGNYYDYIRMGVRLPFILTVDDMSMVLVPTRDNDGKLLFTNATIKTSSLHQGYLPYTPKNILTQAFKFLNSPYGWGGSFGEQDCSKFIQEVFATVGIRMPRNSMSQSLVGDNFLKLKDFNKDTKRTMLLESALAGATIIHLQGHIMLYIGFYKGEPYVIQTVWGESKKHFALGRTAVTSLNFNNYIDKIDRATLIVP